MSTDPVYDVDDTTKNLELLEEQSPANGRRIQEDGTIINIADAYYSDDGNITIRV